MKRVPQKQLQSPSHLNKFTHPFSCSTLHINVSELATGHLISRVLIKKLLYRHITSVVQHTSYSTFHYTVLHSCTSVENGLMCKNLTTFQDSETNSHLS